MRASELNSGMNVIEIIDEYFQTMRTFCPDHENIIDISPPRGVGESVGFEHTKKKVRLPRLESLLRKSLVSLSCESKVETRGLMW